MLKLIIEDDEGRKTIVPFVREEITIGRQEGNTIRLTERNVSRRHARLVRHNGSVLVEDLGSYNGIRINGERISGPASIHDGDLIQIGDYDLAIQTDTEVQATQQGASNGNEATQPGVQAPVSANGHDPDDFRRATTAIISVEEVAAEQTQEIRSVHPSEAPKLTVLTTELAGMEFACLKSEMRIGRGEDNDVALDHRSLSRLHCKLVRDEGSAWSVVDLQSANGLTVNGEPYGRTALRDGDVIELGHVQLRFNFPATHVDAAEITREQPAARGGRGVGIAVAVLAGAAALAAGVVMLRKPPEPEPSPPAAVATPPPAPNVLPEPEDPALTEAKLAIEQKAFDRAVALLEKAPATPETTELLDHAKAELTAAGSLVMAERALTAGRLPEAERHLDAANGTTAFADELEQLRAKLEQVSRKAKDVRRRDPKVVTRPAALSTDPQTPTPPAGKDLAEEGAALLAKGQLEDAASSLRGCVEADPDNARCHKLLGATYARLRMPDRGADHYRTFLKLAPNDAQAEQVRKFLKTYEQHKKVHRDGP